jgi:hypothetical protein
VLRTLTVLSDGRYDALVVDAGRGDDDVVVLELTILAGDHKGDVVAVRATGIDDDPLDLLGLPATLIVAGGEPAVTIDDA